MKKIIIVLLLVAMFVTVGYMETHYIIEDAIVYEMSDGNAMIRDCFGEYWCIERATDLKIGDSIKMVMYNNTTTDNKDDKIESYKKLSI